MGIRSNTLKKYIENGTSPSYSISIIGGNSMSILEFAIYINRSLENVDQLLQNRTEEDTWDNMLPSNWHKYPPSPVICEHIINHGFPVERIKKQLIYHGTVEHLEILFNSNYEFHVSEEEKADMLHNLIINSKKSRKFDYLLGKIKDVNCRTTEGSNILSVQNQGSYLCDEQYTMVSIISSLLDAGYDTTNDVLEHVTTSKGSNYRIHNGMMAYIINVVDNSPISYQIYQPLFVKALKNGGTISYNMVKKAIECNLLSDDVDFKMDYIQCQSTLSHIVDIGKQSDNDRVNYLTINAENILYAKKLDRSRKKKPNM